MAVAEQVLSEATYERLFGVVGQEGRALVPLDRDFGEVLRFPPESTAGIVVLARHGRTTKVAIAARTADLATVLKLELLSGRLRIVEPGRFGIHQRRDIA